MRLSDYLAEEWKAALGCTEPAAIAFAAAHAAAVSSGPVRSVHLRCDPRIYKNCYAVGIPYSGGKVGILWAIALGSLLPHPNAGLESLKLVTPGILAEAQRLIDTRAISVEIDSSVDHLLVDVRVVRAEGQGRAVLEREHTRLVRLERDGLPLPLPGHPQDSTQAATEGDAPPRSARAIVADTPFAELLPLARSLTDADRARLHEGIRLNQAIAAYGLTQIAKPLARLEGLDKLTRVNRLVSAGVYARMSGADYSVMSLAGSGNKGIIIGISVPMFGKELGKSEREIDEAMALACLLTSATTHYLGSLSSICGCVNAASVGLAGALVLFQGGGAPEISMAVDNIVGNVTGVICDGAKPGCAVKAMSGVDTAWRAAELALAGVGISSHDGIVGRTGEESLRFLAQIANAGMASMDGQILQIMQSKLRSHA